MLYNVYAENETGARRYIAQCVGDNTGKGVLELYADECRDGEEIVIEQAPESKAAATLGAKGRAVNSPAQQDAARANGAKGGAPAGEPGEYEYTIIVNGQDGQWMPAKSLQSAKIAARRGAVAYGSLAQKALVDRLVDGQRVTVATLESNGYDWAGRGDWLKEI